MGAKSRSLIGQHRIPRMSTMKIPDFKQSDKKYLTLKTLIFISLNIIAARTKSSKSTGISGLQYKTSFGPVEMF